MKDTGAQLDGNHVPQEMLGICFDYLMPGRLLLHGIIYSDLQCNGCMVLYKEASVNLSHAPHGWQRDSILICPSCYC